MLYIFRHNIIPPVQHGAGLGGMHQSDGSAGGYAELQTGVLAGHGGNLGHV